MVGVSHQRARRVALDALRRIDQGSYANLVLPAFLGRSGLDRRDRAMVTELVYGVTRMRRALDFVLTQHLRGGVEPRVQNALRLGVYQLRWMGTPPHAAVAETVAVTSERARGLVNAVLRSVASRAWPPAWPDVATQLSYPNWIVSKLSADLGEPEARDALAAMNEPAVASRREDSYVQDPGSQWVSDLVHARDGDLVVDLCAGPGGKATGVARGGAFVVASDIRPHRAGLVAANAAALGTERVAVVIADGRAPAVRARSASRVLVDAPCTGLGVLRRRADARWRVQEKDVEELAGLQRDLLRGAASLLAEGGMLVYSVCTLTRQETVEVAEWAVTNLALEPLPPPPPPWKPAKHGALLLPQAAGTDGMYIARLRRP